VIRRAAALFQELRAIGVPVVHVVTEYREPGEIAANPFWKAIHDDPTKARRGILRHNLAGSPGTEIIPALRGDGDLVVGGKKRYSAFYATDLEFLLRRLGATTAFEATNRDYRVVIAADAVDSMDGEEMHRFALRLLGAAVGWVWTNEEIVKALRR
jgi:nicotinamidase-related amidase